MHITMHDWRHQWKFFWTAIVGNRADGKKPLQILRIIDHIYIAIHSLSVAWLGKCFPRPWRRDRYESFQTRARLIKLAMDAGFVHVSVRRTYKHMVVSGLKRA